MRESIEKSDIGVTISVGVCTQIPVANSGTVDLIAAADKSLYEAKRAGRNLVRVWKAPLVT